MFDIGGVELLVIAVVAIIVVGPKDLPGLLRRVGKMVAKARNMAGEFKSHFDEVADQEEFKEIRESLESVKDLSPANQIKKAMSPFEDAGSSIKESFDNLDETSPSIAPLEEKAASAKKPARKTARKKPAAKTKKAKASPAKAKKPAGKTAKKAVKKPAAKSTKTAGTKATGSKVAEKASA